MTLPERLDKALAQRKGATKAALARAAKVTPPSVSDWFSGQTKSLMAEPLIRAAHYLGVRPLWLAAGEGPMVDTEAREQAVNYAAGWPFKTVTRDAVVALQPHALRQLERLIAAYLDMQPTRLDPVISWRTVAVNLADEMDKALQHEIYTAFVQKVDELTHTTDEITPAQRPIEPRRAVPR